MLPGIRVNREAMRKIATQGHATATDLADYLAKKGLPFRDAHEAVAKAVRFAVKRGCDLSTLKLNELRKFSKLIGKDVYPVISLEGSIKSRSHIGGTAPKQVKAAILRARKQ
jgi:argininosuccinate lyase